MPHARTLAIGAVLVTVGYVGLTQAQLGPLNPPAGPIGDTGPDLGQLQASLDAAALTQGPWQVFVAPRSGILTEDRTGKQPIASGRVLVHSISASRADLTVFDGPATIDGNGNPTSGAFTPIGRVHSLLSTTGTSGRAAFSTETLQLDVIVENGLYALWTLEGASSTHVVILYRDLPD